MGRITQAPMDVATVGSSRGAVAAAHRSAGMRVLTEQERRSQQRLAGAVEWVRRHPDMVNDDWPCGYAVQAALDVRTEHPELIKGAEFVELVRDRRRLIVEAKVSRGQITENEAGDMLAGRSIRWEN